MRCGCYTSTIVSRDSRRRRGYTLVELLVTMSVSVILMGGMASAMLIARQALPNDTKPAARLLHASGIADQITMELQYAIHITERSANAITFTVADRDGDGSPERIRYVWSGTAGDPLTREYPDGSTVDVLDDVHGFNLAYDVKTVTEEYPGLPVEGPEVTLSSYNDPWDPKDYKIDKDHWIGQYFKPSLPADAVSWRVTRLFFMARKEDLFSEMTWVQLRMADGNNKPTETVLEQLPMYEYALSWGYDWEGFSFANAGPVAAGEGLCLVLEHPGSGESSAKIQYDDKDGTGRLKTSNHGDSWEYSTDKSMIYWVNGKISTRGPTQTASRTYVTGIRMALQGGDDAAARLDTAIHMLNTPEVLSAVWELDFDTDPTALDMNGDGLGDWAVRNEQIFDTDTLIDGVWHADATLDTHPNNDFTGLTTAEIRFRNTNIGGNGAVFWINADSTGSTFAPIFAFLQLQSDNTQTLKIYHKRDTSTQLLLVSVPGLPASFVTLRLLVDPSLDTVNVKVNSEDQATFNYNTISASSADRFATVMPGGSSAEFDYVSVRVGGAN